MSDSGYTPSMQTIREAFAVWYVTDETAATRRAQFDSALAVHDAEVRADQIEKDAAICQRIQDDPEFQESGPGVVTAKIVIRAQRAAAIVPQPSTPDPGEQLLRDIFTGGESTPEQEEEQ